MRRSGPLVAAAAAGALLAAAAGMLTHGGGAAPPAREAGAAAVLAWRDGSLARVDPRTLRAIGPSLRIDLGPTALSPGGETLAAAASNAGRVRLVDVRRMRLIGKPVELGPLVHVDTLHWLDATLLAVVAWGDPPRLLVVDTEAGAVVGRQDLPGVVLARARTRHALTLLLGPADRVGPSTLVAVDAARGVRSARLSGVLSGHEPSDAGEGAHRQLRPGLAADPDGSRALVLPPAGPVAEVDLATLAVRARGLARPVSLLGRLRSWLEPEAHAKSLAGPERHAVWVGNGSVAVAAVEHVGIAARDGEHRQLARAAGVDLIGTRGWSVRRLSERAGAVAVADGTLLVYGGPFAAGGSFSADDGPPVACLEGFAPDGARRFRLCRGPVRHVETAGRYAYAWRAGALDVVDVAAGRVVATVRTVGPLAVVAG